MFWQKIGNSVSDGLFRDSVRDSVIAENQCLYVCSIDKTKEHVGDSTKESLGGFVIKKRKILNVYCNQFIIYIF